MASGSRDADSATAVSDVTNSVHDAGFGNTDTASEQIKTVGAGIKGPLAFADAKIFLLDPSFTDFYDKISPIATAITNSLLRSSDFRFPDTAPYILTIGGDHAIDLNTGEAPVISTLITVITEDTLASKRPINSTPLTTMAFQMARHGVRAPGSEQITSTTG